MAAGDVLLDSDGKRKLTANGTTMLLKGAPDDCYCCETIEPEGAICYPDGTCAEGTEQEAIDTGGTYQGDGTACDDIGMCPGAICPDGGVDPCYQGTLEEANAAGDAYMGFDTDCVDVDCDCVCDLDSTSTITLTNIVTFIQFYVPASLTCEGQHTWQRLTLTSGTAVHDPSRPFPCAYRYVGPMRLQTSSGTNTMVNRTILVEWWEGSEVWHFSLPLGVFTTLGITSVEMYAADALSTSCESATWNFYDCSDDVPGDAPVARTSTGSMTVNP